MRHPVWIVVIALSILIAGALTIALAMALVEPMLPSDPTSREHAAELAVAAISAPVLAVVFGVTIFLSRRRNR